MIKKLLLILSLAFIFSSCAITTDETLPTVDVVVRYGTPYYYDNTLTYYRYNGWYYYPYYRGRIMYYHRYDRPVRPRVGRPMIIPGHPRRPSHTPVPSPRPR